MIRDKALSKYAKFSDHSAWRVWLVCGFVVCFFVFFFLTAEKGESGGKAKKSEKFCWG